MLPARESIRTLREILVCLFLVGQLSWEAYRQRIREGRSIFAPTLPDRSRLVGRVSLAGRSPQSEPFLRPTRFVDCHAPEIIALADHFRARTSSDWEYAAAIFNFACNQIDLSFDLPPRRGVVGTIDRGSGTCIEKLNVFVALARAGGLPARYCAIGTNGAQRGIISLRGDDDGIFGLFDQPSKRFIAENNDLRAKRILSLVAWWSSGVRRPLTHSVLAADGEPTRTDWPHFVAEVRIEQRWVAADPTHGDAECAASAWPLQRFGYEPLILGRFMGTVIKHRSEDLPFRWRRYLFWLAHVCTWRGFLDHINRFNACERLRGQRILDQVGTDAMIAKRQHLYRPSAGVADVVG